MLIGVQLWRARPTPTSGVKNRIAVHEAYSEKADWPRWDTKISKSKVRVNRCLLYQKRKDYESLKLVLDRFYRAEAFSKAWHDNGEEWYKRYRFYKSPGKYPYKHNVKDRLTFTICEVITARVLQALFAVSPFLSIVPREGNDIRMAKQLERVLEVLIGDPSREFFLEFVDFVKQAIIYGTSYLSVTPRFNTSKWEFDG